MQFGRLKLTPETPSAPEPYPHLVNDLTGMLRDADAWDKLGSAPISSNPYFSRSFIQAHAEFGLFDAARLRFIVIGEPSCPAAILPLIDGAARCGWKRIDSACSSPYMMTATPLVGRDANDNWAEGLLEALRRQTSDGAFIFPRLALDSPVALGMIKTVQRLGWNYEVLDEFHRPVAQIADSYDTYAKLFLSRNRRKGIRRLRHRLAQQGKVRHDVVSGGPRLDFAVETFLDLEARGWKGMRGTALANQPETAAMLRKLLQESQAGAKDGVNMRADILLLDEHPIAISIGFTNCGIGYMWKITLDEAYRKFAPGIILEAAILQSAHQSPMLSQLDSATGPGTPLDSLYGDRSPIGDLVLAPPSMRGFRTLLVVEKLRRRVRVGLKSLRNRLLRRN